MNKTISFKAETEDTHILKNWWDRELETNPGVRATLRRCQNPAEVVFHPAYHLLRQKLISHEFYVNENLSTVVGLLAHVKENNTTKLFAEQLATKKDAEKAKLSGLRFRRLLSITDKEKFFIDMIRVLRLIDNCANIVNLAHDTYYWGDDVRKQWAYKYYELVPKEN